jgi:hypothetical protein
MRGGEPEEPEDQRDGSTPDDLQDRLRRHKVIIANAAAVKNAVAREDVRIIQVADACTANQFNAEQERLLRNWVAEGGILWVNSDVLLLFGIRSGRVDEHKYDCQPAGGNIPILEGVRNVRLLNLDGTAHTLEHSRLIPLLASTREGFLLGDEEVKVGTTLWSLVPYGKGWISDVKEVDLNHGEGALFWTRFCQFCLGELVLERPPGWNRGEGEQQALGPLTGQWKSVDGDVFWLADDGQQVTIKLLKSESVLKELFGTLKRQPKPKPREEAKPVEEGQVPPAGHDDTFEGYFDLNLNNGWKGRVKVTARMNGKDLLRLESRDWPRPGRRGLVRGRAEATWQRVAGGAPGPGAAGVPGAPDAAPLDEP